MSLQQNAWRKRARNRAVWVIWGGGNGPHEYDLRGERLFHPDNHNVYVGCLSEVAAIWVPIR